MEESKFCTCLPEESAPFGILIGYPPVCGRCRKPLPGFDKYPPVKWSPEKNDFIDG